jgi:hypothetical protein
MTSTPSFMKLLVGHFDSLVASAGPVGALNATGVS